MAQWAEHGSAVAVMQVHTDLIQALAEDLQKYSGVRNLAPLEAAFDKHHYDWANDSIPVNSDGEYQAPQCGCYSTACHHEGVLCPGPDAVRPPDPTFAGAFDDDSTEEDPVNITLSEGEFMLVLGALETAAKHHEWLPGDASPRNRYANILRELRASLIQQDGA